MNAELAIEFPFNLRWKSLKNTQKKSKREYANIYRSRYRNERGELKIKAESCPFPENKWRLIFCSIVIGSAAFNLIEGDFVWKKKIKKWKIEIIT